MEYGLVSKQFQKAIAVNRIWSQRSQVLDPQRTFMICKHKLNARGLIFQLTDSTLLGFSPPLQPGRRFRPYRRSPVLSWINLLVLTMFSHCSYGWNWVGFLLESVLYMALIVCGVVRQQPPTREAPSSHHLPTYETKSSSSTPVFTCHTNMHPKIWHVSSSKTFNMLQHSQRQVYFHMDL